MTSLLDELNGIQDGKNKMKLDFQKVIEKQSQVISILKKQIALLRNVITKRVQSMPINHSLRKKEEQEKSNMDLSRKNSHISVGTEISEEIDGEKAETMKILGIESAEVSWTIIYESVRKLKQSKEMPIFVEKIKEKKVPVFVEKIKEVEVIKEVEKEVIVQKIVYIEKEKTVYVEKEIRVQVPIFKEKVIYKFRSVPGTNQAELTLAQTQTDDWNNAN